MPSIGTFLKNRYPSRFSVTNYNSTFPVIFFMDLILFIGSSLGYLDAIDPTINFYNGSAVPAKYAPIFLGLSVLSGVIWVVMLYLEVRRYKTRKEARRLIQKYVYQISRGEVNLEEITKDARYVDEGELYALINDMEQEGILKDL